MCFSQVRVRVRVRIVAVLSGNLLIYTHLGGFKLPVWRPAVRLAATTHTHIPRSIQPGVLLCSSRAVCVCVCAHNSSAYLVVAKGSLP